MPGELVAWSELSGRWLGTGAEGAWKDAEGALRQLHPPAAEPTLAGGVVLHPAAGRLQWFDLLELGRNGELDSGGAWLTSLTSDGYSNWAAVTERGVLRGSCAREMGWQWLDGSGSGCCWWRGGLWWANHDGEVWCDGELRFSLGACRGETLGSCSTWMWLASRDGRLFYWRDNQAVRALEFPWHGQVRGGLGRVVTTSLAGCGWADLDTGASGGWPTGLTGPVSAPAALGSGWSVLLAYDGRVSAFSGRELLWSQQLPEQGFVLPPLVLEGRVHAAGPEAVWSAEL